MSERKGAPKYLGPWQVNREMSDEKGLAFIEDAAGEVICALDDLATAHRMAASDDLYRALSELVRDVAKFSDVYGGPRLERSFAALSKARGEA